MEDYYKKNKMEYNDLLMKKKLDNKFRWILCELNNLAQQ